MNPPEAAATSTWLSEEWFDRVRSASSDADRDRALGTRGRGARIQQVITGGPEGDVSCAWVLEGGRLTTATSGALDPSDVTVTSSWTDAAAMWAGTLDPSVAYMQGRLKVAGSMALALPLLAASHGGGCQETLRRIAAFTRF